LRSWPEMRSGFLLIDKEEGLRSTACVEAVRRSLGRDFKVGHAGTLDSGASGLLVALVGRATRLSNLVMSFPKEYRALVRLGIRTDTEDITGRILDRCPVPRWDAGDLSRVLASFLGCRLQRPPAVSAVHVGGRRAHELARSGEEPNIVPREVFVRRIEVGEMLGPDVVSIRVSCGKGTYVRSIARDLGERLGTWGTIERLRRTSVGPFRVEDALPSGQMGELGTRDLLSRLIPLERLGEFLPGGRVPAELDALCSNGGAIRIRDLEAFSVRAPYVSGGLVLVRYSRGMGIYQLVGDGRLECRVNLPD